MKEWRPQSGIELLITYSLAILGVAIIVALFFTISNRVQNTLPESCSIYGTLGCTDIAFVSNSAGSTLVVLASSQVYGKVNISSFNAVVGGEQSTSGYCRSNITAGGSTQITQGQEIYCIATFPITSSNSTPNQPYAGTFNISGNYCPSGTGRCPMNSMYNFRGSFRTYGVASIQIVSSITTTVSPSSSSTTTSISTSSVTTSTLTTTSVPQSTTTSSTSSTTSASTTTSSTTSSTTVLTTTTSSTISSTTSSSTSSTTTIHTTTTTMSTTSTSSTSTTTTSTSVISTTTISCPTLTQYDYGSCFNAEGSQNCFNGYDIQVVEGGLAGVLDYLDYDYCPSYGFGSVEITGNSGSGPTWQCSC